MRNFIITSVLFFLAQLGGFAQPWYQGTNPPSVFNSASSNSYRMGNVGIGNFSNVSLPGANLHIKKFVNGATPILRFSNDQPFTVGGNLYGRIEATNSLNGVVAAINFTPPSNIPVGQTGPGPMSAIEFFTSNLNDATPVRRMTISHEGNVGIGTNTPTEKIQILGGQIKIEENNKHVFVSSGGLVFNGFGTTMINCADALSFGTFNAERLKILHNGKIIIGESAMLANVNDISPNTGPDNYRLYVTDGIRTEQIKVDLRGNWADFVFDSCYNLPKLSDVKDYVRLNKHLPDVPSEMELKASGINLAEMDAILIKKIEELTLYIIEQDAKIQELESKLTNTSND